MHIENKENCTGCGACFNICPKKAITMDYNEYGFYVPRIDAEKCINCGLCEKICPLDSYKSNNFEKPRVYAFQNDDEEILYKCASGGAFAKLANDIIKQNGVVYGVVYDENMTVCHSRCDNIKDLEKMYSSKYVQSDTKETFKQTKQDLENGKTVLFSGTPCQIAGLYSYLQKDYENLITVDLVCHGVPSPLVFEKYKQEISKKLKTNDEILNIDFRSKINGWNPYSLNIETKQQNNINITSSKSRYMKLFLNNLNINTSCLNCQFNDFPRVADITLGDFWGVDNYDKSLNNNKGLSVIIINSDKGQSVFNNIQDMSQEVPIDVVVQYNPNIVTPSKPHPKRKEFFECIKKGKNLSYCAKRYCKDTIPFYVKFASYLPEPIKIFIKSVLKIS